MLLSRLGILALLAAAAACAVEHRPVFQVDVADPTADKPQSKLWYARGSWWALLPRKSGPSLWERAKEGWKEHTAATAAMAGLPKRGDVWFDRDGATAVLEQGRRFAILRLTPSAATWRTEVLADWTVPGQEPMETSTIVRDGAGRWWVSAVLSREVRVWSSADARRWEEVPALAAELDKDDICSLAVIRGGVGVFWSDQARDGVFFRVHRDKAAPAEWLPAEVVEQGGKTADDHINAALTADGRLWVATKNSVDAVGAPQQVLRVRGPQGGWTNAPYAPLSKGRGPSRPIVVVTPGGRDLFYGHTIYASPRKEIGEIVFGRILGADPRRLGPETTMILPEAALGARVNNVTRAKGWLPAEGPWIVLASDGEGRVYEADLRSLR